MVSVCLDLFLWIVWCACMCMCMYTDSGNKNSFHIACLYKKSKKHKHNHNINIPTMASFCPFQQHKFHRTWVKDWKRLLSLIESIRYDAPDKQICFSPAMTKSKSLKKLEWCGNDVDESRLANGAFCIKLCRWDLSQLNSNIRHIWN